jgi:hypothetical protein
LLFHWRLLASAEFEGQLGLVVIIASAWRFADRAALPDLWFGRHDAWWVDVAWVEAWFLLAPRLARFPRISIWHGRRVRLIWECQIIHAGAFAPFGAFWSGFWITLREQAGTDFQFTSVIGYLNYHLILVLGGLILVRSQFLLIFIVLRFRVKIYVLDLAKVALFLGLTILIELIIEQAIAKGAFFEISIVWVARFAVNVLP